MLPEQDIEVQRPWDRMDDEPEVWYRIFSLYYLPLGTVRSLRTAFEFYIKTECPPHYSDVDPDSFKNIPSHWSEYARKFEWARRATAYDTEKIPDISSLQVNMVLEYLRSNAMLAAGALVESLTNPRTQVQAANAILNRTGVPEVGEINLRTNVMITADEMAAAQSKVEQWKISKQSG